MFEKKNSETDKILLPNIQNLIFIVYFDFFKFIFKMRKRRNRHFKLFFFKLR